MKTPNLIHANMLAENYDTHALINGRYVPARPLAVPFGPVWFRRIRLAYRVLIGKCDALQWEGQ